MRGVHHRWRDPVNEFGGLTLNRRWRKARHMKHSVPHDLGQERAKRVTDAAWSSYSKRFDKYSPTMSWVSDDEAKIGFTAKGFSLDGAIQVRPNSIDLLLDVPFLLRPFQKMAIGVIEQEIRSWIQKSENGEI